MSHERRDAASALAHGRVTSADIEAVRRNLERAEVSVARRLRADAAAHERSLRARGADHAAPVPSVSRRTSAVDLAYITAEDGG